MNQPLPAELLSRLSAFVTSQMGLYFPEERWRDLERGIRAAALESGAVNAETYGEGLLSAPPDKVRIEILASALTVGETYFFRENRSFEVLGERFLPELIRTRQAENRRLRIWSAGCCTGEEAYTIAILLDRILPGRREWDVTILATDINPRFLKKAADGVYGEWSFRNPPEWLKKCYFKEVGTHRYEIVPRIKQMVTFSQLNLAEDTYPSLTNNTNAMDVIFCRNVLMYFAPERARKVVGNFHRSLVDGGKLIVSPTETSPQLFSKFTPLYFEGAVLYGKENGRPVAPAFSFPSEMPPVHHEPAMSAQVFAPIPELPPAAAVQEQKKQPTVVAPTSYNEALALYEQGDYSGAAQKLETDENHVTAESAALMARVCANLGLLGEARVWAENAIAMDKLNAGLHYLRAIILQEQDALEESAGSLKRALYLDPGFVLAHYALGNLAQRKHNARETARHFANALDLLKNCAPADVLPYSDGLAAGRLAEILHAAVSTEAIA